MTSDYIKIIDAYQKLRADREQKALEFLSGERKHLIYQVYSKSGFYTDADSKEVSFERNIHYIGESLKEKSDHIPALEPWFGTGVYANMYGCKYYWRKDEAPAVHYLYHSLDDVAGIKSPRWQDSEIARMVMETIRYFKSKTGDAIPIILTDTQSASDTATLIVDASEILMGCLIEPELVMGFMRDINRLIIEFSQAQADLIGAALIRPGHLMYSSKSSRGISVSDDNIAVVSPQIAKDFNLVLNEEIGQAMGGVGIHSCGVWANRMVMIKDVVPSCSLVHCSLSTDWDPTPNKPEDVRDAMAGAGIPVHVRVPGNTDQMLDTVRRVMHPDLRLIVQPRYIDDATAERNYYELDALLGGAHNDEANG